MDSIQSLGLPLHSAIFEFVPAEFKEVAVLFQQRVIRGTATPMDSTWRLLYGEVASRVLIGELEALGTRHGQVEAEVIPARFVLEARPNIEAGTIEHAGVTYHGVRIRVSKPQAETASKPQEGRRPPVSYREADRLLVAEMEQLINSGKAKGIQDAARAVVDRADGSGTDASKVKRLITAFSQSGQY